MSKILVVLSCVLLACGCSFNIKTVLVADYQRFDQLQSNNTKSDIQIMLGSPQGKGLHILEDKSFPLEFYLGFAGVATLSTVRYDSGTAFISYDGENAVHALYFTSKLSGAEIQMSKDLPIKKLIGKVVLGESNVQQVFSALGPPEYEGRRIDFLKGLNHRVAFYDGSKLSNDGVIQEKWILIGYDDQGVTQDLVWVSSLPEDIAELGKVEAQQIKQLSRLTFVGLFPFDEPQALTTSTKIDPTQVDALMSKRPIRISQIKDILGPPSALGIKSFAGDTPKFLSNWSYSKIEMKGTEKHFVPMEASDEQRAKLEAGETYMVMDVSQSRLMIGHDKDGSIREIMWVKPFNP